MAPRAVINRYCIACHHAQNKTAGLALDGMDPLNVGPHAERWEKVVRKLSARYMPPSGAPRPDEATYNALLDTLKAGLDRLAVEKPNPGRTESFRRMNRTEYRNAVRDLLALDVDVAAMLPNDESSHGFDNVTVTDLSPTLLERYMSAARKVSRMAVGAPVSAPMGHTVYTPADLTQEEHFEELPFGTRGGVVVQHTFPLDAFYEVQLRLARDRNEHVEGLRDTHQVELLMDGERVQVFTVKAPAGPKDHAVADQHLNARVFVKAGPHRLGATFLKKRSALPETERQPYQAHFNMDRHPRIQPAVYSVTINGPYEATGPGDTPSRRRLFVCKPASEAEELPCVKKILSTVTRRAYRRAVTEADLRAPLKFFTEGRKEGFENGVEMALRAVLVSPEFLFRVEQEPAKAVSGAAYRVSDLELASRLSFFLWSSIPDDELLDAAIGGRLREPAVLEKQVRRMLADERASTLVTNFAEQWLYLRNLSSATPDMRVFPGFDDNLRRAFRRETEMFFESIWREDRNVLDLLRANYTYVNERLAKHYGIPNVYGSRFRRVTFDGESERGGLLRQGSVLTVTSYATRTSPVLRGKWIMDNLLGVPPPVPPPQVPALKEKHEDGKALTMRQRMSQHRENPVCAACHNMIDPVGFALENYDAVGRYRKTDDGAAIDAQGSLPDGRKFDGVDGLEQALLQYPEAFLTTFTGKLITYGLGRGPEYYDAPAVRKIVSGARSEGYKFSSFILGIVGSTPFQMRRAQ
ncbi:MAG: DUF1592 domain-containing protein [Bryobacterales bacterium]|nr:DUF1592 domain-containing protein [Bryobacterales bacterium]